jgi:hypothetical protein
MPDQRVSTAKKTTDKNWYIPMANFVIDLAVSSADKSKTISFMNAANGIMDKSDYAYVMKTYMNAGEATDVERELEAERLGKLRDVDILTPIKEKYMGEFINSYHNYQVYSLDPDVIFKRNNQLGEKVVEKMMAKLKQLLTSPDKQSNINIKEFIQKELDTWEDENVAKEQRALELLNAEVEAKRKYIDAYFNWWACEEVYTYRRLVGNDVELEIVDNLEYYRVDSGNYFVEDDNYGLRRSTLTLQEIIDKLYFKMNIIDEKQKALLDRICKDSTNGVGLISPTIFMDYRDQFQGKDSPRTPIKFTKRGLQTTFDHYFFKTETKVGILKYMTNQGVPSEMEVDDTYELDTANGDISIEWKWIDQIMEGYVFGLDSHRIYTAPKLIDLQRELVTNISVCKAPYNGCSYIHKNNAKKPIAFRIKPNLILYQIYTLLEERWLNKFKSWLLLPESILADSKTMKVEERVQQADVDSLFPFNDLNMQANPNAWQMFKEVAMTSVVNYITVLNQVKQSIKQDAFELANMNGARLGQNGQYKGKATSEYDYNQAITGTVWSLEMFNTFREKDYMANLDYSRAAWVDGKQGSYVDPNTGEVVYVEVDGLAHLGANVGLFVSNSSELNAQAKALQDIAFSMGQNDQYEVAAEAVTNKNIGKLKEVIKKAAQAKRDFELQMSDAKERAMLQIKQVEAEDNKAQRDHEITIQDNQIEADYDIEILRSETDISINEAKLQVDTNGNGYVDQQEAQNISGIDQVDTQKARAIQVLNERKQALAELKQGHQIVKDRQAAKAKQSKK